MNRQIVKPVEGSVTFHGINDSRKYDIRGSCGRAGSNIQADHGDFSKVRGAVGRDVADKVSTHHKGSIHVFFSQHVHGCEFPWVITGVSACEIKPERIAVHVGSDLVKACNVTVATESSKSELGIVVQFLYQVHGNFGVPVLSYGGGEPEPN